jgi:ADP-ribose pyrophosphatase
MEIVGVQRLTEEKWLNLFATTYRNGDKEGRWLFASRHRKPYDPNIAPDAAVIVPILLTPDQPPRVVLIKEFRIPLGGYIYAFPAGLVDDGESIDETVRRELLEETGLEVIRIKRITTPLCSSAGLTDEMSPLVFVEARESPNSKQKLDGMEDIEVVLLDYQQVCEMVENRAVRFDAKAWTILFMYQQLGKLV